MKPIRFLFLLVLFATLVFGYYPAAGAATLYVDGVSGNDSNDGSAWDKAKKSIGAGVNAALAGDTVLVAKATYTLSAPITVNKTLTIRSQDGYPETIIDGNLAVNHCFYLYHYSQLIQVTIEGFTIQKGNATGVTYYPEYNGGGICIDSGARATIRNCYITKNKATGHGGGVFFGTYGNVLENTFLVENTAKGGGGVHGNNVTARGCTVTGNTATGDAYLDGGGGISSTNGGGLVENSTFNSNTAKAGGGGVFFNAGGMVRNCTFTDNQAQQGYGNGGGVFSGAQGTVENCTFNGNFAYGYGGGVYMTGGGLIRNCTINGNTSRLRRWGLYSCLRNGRVLHHPEQLSGQGRRRRPGISIRRGPELHHLRKPGRGELRRRGRGVPLRRGDRRALPDPGQPGPARGRRLFPLS